MGRGRRGPGIAREARRTSRPPPRGTFVEVNDPASRLMPGSAQAERDEILGDSLDRTVAWKGGPDPGGRRGSRPASAWPSAMPTCSCSGTDRESWVTVAEGVRNDEASRRGAKGAVFVARIIWNDSRSVSRFLRPMSITARTPGMPTIRPMRPSWTSWTVAALSTVRRPRRMPGRRAARRAGRPSASRPIGRSRSRGRCTPGSPGRREPGDGDGPGPGIQGRRQGRRPGDPGLVRPGGDRRRGPRPGPPAGRGTGIPGLDRPEAACSTPRTRTRRPS